MAQQKTEHVRLALNRQERKLLAQVINFKPEYATWTPADVAKWELRTYLLEQIKSFNKRNAEQSGKMGILSNLARTFDDFLFYRLGI